ncbi:MAG TPA: VOC family protein, partial [Chloroflexota bacterium]|nr:VOC family protein [Chloroflexota bacterium]
IGIFCRDLDKMEAFYRDTLGMKVTKRRPGNMVFLSSDPARSDHEIALMKGRPQEDHYNIIQQISMRVATLDDVREFHTRLRSAGLKIDYVTSHCSGIGCYYFDPEGNHCEVFWRTHRDCWVPTGSDVNFDTMTNDDILALIERQYAELGHVPVGKTLDEVGPAPVAVAG